MEPQIIEHPSPNQEDRPRHVDILLLHYTGMESGQAALERLCDPAAKVSSHYLVEEDGRVFRLVPEERRAWHAGVGAWRGESDLNDRSIGIEIVNPGHEFGYRPFPAVQMESVTRLSRAILARHPIPPERVLGHSDVAPLRKSDPGELFDWPGLAAAGIGFWPEGLEAPPSPGLVPAITWFQSALARYGYAVPRSGELDSETEAALTAFQRHFRPARVDGLPDRDCADRLKRLLAALDHAGRSA